MYRSMLVMMGAIRKAVLAAAVASEKIRQGRWAVFHFFSMGAVVGRWRTAWVVLIKNIGSLAGN